MVGTLQASITQGKAENGSGNINYQVCCEITFRCDVRGVSFLFLMLKSKKNEEGKG